MLPKIRHFVNFNALERHLIYWLTVLAKNANLIKRLLVIENKFLQIMHFSKRNTHKSNLYKNLIILKPPGKVSL